MSSVGGSPNRSRTPEVRQGGYGTAMFKGSERFSSNKPKSNAFDVEVRPSKGMADLSLDVAKKASSSWGKQSTPRFGRDHHRPAGGSSSGGPGSKGEPTATDMYTPPGIGDVPTNRKSVAFSQTTPRLSSLSPNRSSRADESSGSIQSNAAYVLPTFVDELLKSKKGSTLFAGKPQSRFSNKTKSPTAGVTNIYNGGGIADRVASSKSNPMKAGGHAPRFTPQSARDRSASPGNPSGAAPGDVVDVDLHKYSIAGQAEKNRGKGCWSKRTANRLTGTVKPLTDPETMYMPPEFGTSVKGPNFQARKANRFCDPNAKNRLESTTDAGLYELPTFVDLILKK